MDLKEIIDRPTALLRRDEGMGIVLSSRVRLARNLKETSFPGWAGDDECERVWHILRAVLGDAKIIPDALIVPMTELKGLEKLILFERNLISREHLEKGVGSGVVISPDERLSVMVNEEDHLRLQAILGGLQLEQAWKSVDRLDSEIEAEVDYAYSINLGYLTACPSNVGTGIRASVMLHVPGLVLMEEIAPIVKGMGKIGLAVRGLGGEGSEAHGNMFQISNQITLGEKEEAIIENLNEIVLEVVEHEENARKRLLQKKEHLLRDHVGRALGILSNAHILTSKEALDELSALRLGVDMGIVNHINAGIIDELLLLSRPGHLQKLEGKSLNPRDRDIARAGLLRKRLTEAD